MNNSYCACWICSSTNVHLKRKGSASGPLRPEFFRITAADYGVTSDIYVCSDCGFLFCPTVGQVLHQYEQMTDTVYESTRDQRALQAREILKTIATHKPNGELLDVGAGSGILVEEAIKHSYSAKGIEPSAALSHTAQRRHLPVVTGTLPQPEFHDRFDIITLIDVIEHVDAPLALLSDATACMNSDAICVIVTPDVNSMAARLMGKKWWHYRLAHIGYFNLNSLTTLLHRAGLEVISMHRPAWYFPASYLIERLLSYLPGENRIKMPKWLDKITIPLNLFDSLLVVCKKRRT